MPANPPLVKFLVVILLLLGASGAADFSRKEWDDPGRSGSSLWIRNGRGRMVALDAFYVRTSGLRTYREVALNAGTRRLHFTAAGDSQGGWVRLVPRSPRRVWVRARDSLMLSRFECGRGLVPGKGPRRAAEEFALDLKVVDNWGDTSVVRLFQMEPRYDISESPKQGGPGSASAAWSTLDVTPGDLRIP
jgi:hypothetical protein